jgi:hypothetical protein
MDTTIHGRTTLAKVSPTGSQATHNKNLARARMEKNCSFRTIACCQCKLGLDKCPLATRQKTKETADERESSSVGP